MFSDRIFPVSIVGEDLVPFVIDSNGCVFDCMDFVGASLNSMESIELNGFASSTNIQTAWHNSIYNDKC